MSEQSRTVEELASIKKGETRILHPWEFEAMRRTLADRHRPLFDTAVLTGMRYVELQRFQKHKEWLVGRFVVLPKGASLKVKARQSERTVKLSNIGQVIVPMIFSQGATQYPTIQGWGRLLVRAAERAKIDTELITPKTTRKTWENWLGFYYAANPQAERTIRMSQGHTGKVAEGYYLNPNFIPSERAEMAKWCDGVME